MRAITIVEAKPICIKILVRYITEVATRVIPIKSSPRLAPKLYPIVLCHMASLAAMITNSLQS